MVPIVFIFVSFLCGSLPFSLWLGKIFLRLDIRWYGDGNPGAANVFRSGHRLAGIFALMLDISKAAAPVGIAYHQLHYRGLLMLCVALAPVLGHVFSPFLNFKGGKAIAASFGVWIGLTIWRAALPGALGSLIGIALLVTPGWAVMFALVCIFATLLLWMPDPLLLAVWAGEVLILAWTHRSDLKHRPTLRPSIKRILLPHKS